MGKLIRPTLGRASPRERLFKLLDGMRQRPLIWITGPAGSGKTILVNSYLQARNLPCIWYQIEETDTDPATFFYYLGQAEKRPGGNGRESLPLLTAEYLESLQAFTRRYFENLMGRLNTPAAIILDDYGELPSGSSIHEIILGALSVLRENINFILVSRKDPPPDLIRLQGDKKMEILGWDKLRLTVEEAGEIVRVRSGKVLLRKEMAGLHKACDGWVAGLKLALRGNRFEDLVVKPNGDFNAESIFDRGAAEIFERTREGAKQFLLRASFLPQMTAATAEELNGPSRVWRILSILSRNNDFTEERIGSQALYRYHSLLKNFLYSRAKMTFSAEEISRLRQKAGEILERCGPLEDAARVYREGKDWENFIRFITRHAETFFEQGRFRTLQDWIRSVPGEKVENHPWLLYWLGACQVSLNAEGGMDSFKKAFTLFEKQEDVTGSYYAWAACVHMLTEGQNESPSLAPWVEWLTERMRVQPGFPSPKVEARVAVSLAGALLIVKPQDPDLGTWIERSLSLSRDINDVNLKVRARIIAAHWFQLMGDMARCSGIAEELEKMLQSPSASPLLQIVKNWVDACVFNLGPTAEYLAALQSVEAGLEIARTTGISSLNAMLLIQAVVASLNSGDLDKAGKFLQEMHATLKSRQRLIFSRYHYLSAWYCLLLGDCSQALFHARTAMKMNLESGSSSQEIPCRLEMAQILKSAGDIKNATAQLDMAGELVPGCGSPLLEYSFLLTKAQFTLDEEEASGLDYLDRALALGRSQGFTSMYFWWDPSVMSRLCATALAENIEPDFVRNLIRKRNLLPDVYGRTLQNWPWPLKIFTLGHFKLEKYGKRLLFPGKAPHKALLMMKILIALGGKEVPEERVTDLLWPESEGDTAHIAFKTLLSRLRQLLGVKDVIESQGGQVSFNPEMCWVDTWAFGDIYEEVKKTWGDKRLPDRFEKAQKLTESAMAIYKGNFLQCDQEHEWAALHRERLRKKFLFLITRMGERLEEAQKWSEAVDHYEKAIEVDPLTEEFYQSLMNCYLHLGQCNDGIATYRHFRKIFSEHMGAAPSRKTEAIYQSLLNVQSSPVDQAA